MSRGDSAAPPGVNHWVVALTVTLATFMEVLDTSIANVALPHIAGSMAASRSQSTWVLTSYLMANAIVLPLSGWLSNLMGRKRFYMSCVALFTISSVLCGLASSLGELILFRILQGAGGGGLQPSEQGILVDTFPAEKRGMAMAVYGMAVVVAPVLGPTLGGWITDNYSWRWIFFINVPVGILSLVLTSFVVKDPPYMVAERKKNKGKVISVDYIGIGLIALGLGALEIIYDKGQEDDWFGSNFIIALMVTTVVCLSAAVIWELRHPSPIVNFRLLGERNFLAVCLLSFATFATLYAVTTDIPQMLQDLYHYDATRAGLVLSPSGLVTMVTMPIVGYLMGRKLDARILLFAGMLTLVGSLVWMTQLDLTASPTAVMLPRCVQMLGIGLLFVPLSTAAYIYIPQAQVGNAAGIYNLLRNEGGSFGIAISTVMLDRRSQFHQNRLVERVTEANPRTHQVIDQYAAMARAAGFDPVTAQSKGWGMLYRTVQQQARILAYIDIYHVLAAIAIAALFLIPLMKPSVSKGGASIE